MKAEKKENNNKNRFAKKNKPFDTVRVTSIARKINLNNAGRMFLAYIGMDILVLVILIAIFVIGMDLQMTGKHPHRAT